MRASVIEIENAGVFFTTKLGVFKYQKTEVLKNIDLIIEEGEFLGVLGGNGSGKSTLLRLIAGVYKPDIGVVKRKKGIKYSLLSLGLGFDNELTGRENSIISGMLNGLSYKESLENINEIKEFSELNKYFDRPVKTYSSGMKSRLGLSVALTNKVDLLLIDETLSVGDKAFKEKSREALVSHIKDNKTVVIVSHNEGQIRKLCNKAIILDKGEVVESGSAKYVSKIYSERCSSGKTKI